MRSLGRYYAIRHGWKFAVLDATTGTVPKRRARHASPPLAAPSRSTADAGGHPPAGTLTMLGPIFGQTKPIVAPTAFNDEA